MKIESLGMIEVSGYLGLIAVADATLKAADVHILQVVKVSGGLTTLQVTGDVGAVQAAIEAGEKVASQLACLVASHVIPRVDQAVIDMEVTHLESLINDSPEEETKVADLVDNQAESSEKKVETVKAKDKKSKNTSKEKKTEEKK